MESTPLNEAPENHIPAELLPVMPDTKAKSFKGISGRSYFILPSMPTGRYAEYEALQIKFGFTATIPELFKQVKEAYLDLNQLKAADCSVRLHNIMQGLANIDAKEVGALELCALFMVAEGEDTGKIDPALIKSKIEDWAKIDIQFFFLHAIASAPGFKPAYKEVTQNTLAAVTQALAQS